MRNRPPTVLDNTQAKTAKPRQGRMRLIAIIGATMIAAGAFWSRQQVSGPGSAHDERGVAALAANDPATAEREWQAGIKEDPQYPNSYSRLGDLYMEEHRFAEAVGLYRQAVTHSPDDGTLEFRLSYAEANTGDKDAARDAARKATQLLPNDATAARRLGVLEAAAGHGDVAYAAFRRAHELDPTDSSSLLNMAVQGLYEPDLAYHRQELDGYLATHPNDYEALYLMAATEERMPRTPSTLADAIKAGERAQVGLPKDIRLARVLGELYLAANRPADALKAYQQGLASTPHSSEMLHGIAISQARLGRSGTQ